MASITIQHGHKNLIFAAQVANETGATFEENGQWITISNSPDLEIPRYAFDEAFDPDRRRAARADIQLESAWRALLVNKCGYLIHFDDYEIVIGDDKPGDAPSMLVRFHTAAEKERMDDVAKKVNLSLNEFALTAIEHYIDALERGIL